ncbi:MAG: hypothetical protein J6S49_01375, partial [Erysipelotrichaceae bacterium]|nr:hypothetical protein [Erysipelotrichaceae bacterium]
VDYYSYDMEANDQLIVSRDEDNKWNFETDKGFKEDRFAKGEGKMSASTAIEIRKPRAYYRLTWRQAAILTIAVGLFALSSFVFYILFAIGRIRYSIRIKNGRIAKESRYTAIPLMGSIVIVLLFLIREFYSVLFPNNRLLQTCFKLVIGLISIQIAFIGYRRERSRLSRMIMYAMMLFALADIVTSYYLIPGSFLHMAAYILLSYAYIEEERPGRNQLIAFGALFILGALIASLIKGEYGMLRLMVIIYLFFVLAMVVLSFPLPRKVFTGSILIFLAGIFLIINQINGETFISHIISLGTYYAGIITLSSMGIRYKASSSGEEDENTDGSPEQTATESK